MKRANGQGIVGGPVKRLTKRVTTDLLAFACFIDGDTSRTRVRIVAPGALIRSVQMTAVIKTNPGREIIWLRFDRGLCDKRPIGFER